MTNKTKIADLIILILIINVIILSIPFGSHAQIVMPGIHGISTVDDVVFTWIMIQSEDEISVNLRYLGNGTTPALGLEAMAISVQDTNDEINTNIQPNFSVSELFSGSSFVNGSWTNPSTITIKLEGRNVEETLFDADLVTVTITPLTS